MILETQVIRNRDKLGRASVFNVRTKTLISHLGDNDDVIAQRNLEPRRWWSRWGCLLVRAAARLLATERLEPVGAHSVKLSYSEYLATGPTQIEAGEASLERLGGIAVVEERRRKWKRERERREKREGERGREREREKETKRERKREREREREEKRER